MIAVSTVAFVSHELISHSCSLNSPGDHSARFLAGLYKSRASYSPPLACFVLRHVRRPTLDRNFAPVYARLAQTHREQTPC